jgi:hypothetical protein
MLAKTYHVRQMKDNVKKVNEDKDVATNETKNHKKLI